MAAKNKSLAQMNKSGLASKTTKKARNPASRVDLYESEHGQQYPEAPLT
jgi:hypothetical protein